MTTLEHLILLAVCTLGVNPALACARRYIEIGVDEARHHHPLRTRLCLVAYYIHHTIAVLLTLGTLFELAHLLILAVGL